MNLGDLKILNNNAILNRIFSAREKMILLLLSTTRFNVHKRNIRNYSTHGSTV